MPIPPLVLAGTMYKTNHHLGRSVQTDKKLCYLLKFITVALVLIAYMVHAWYKLGICACRMLSSAEVLSIASLLTVISMQAQYLVIVSKVKNFLSLTEEGT